jgi:hypothetical protein
MTVDERLALLDRRLGHIPFGPSKADRSLLEMMWDKLDHALDYHRLIVLNVPSPQGKIREITALGIIRYYVDPHRFGISGTARKADGVFHPIGPCLPAVRLFWRRNCPHWWLRFAFQTWAPNCSGIDLIDDPGNRPSNVELDTSKLIVQRLIYDRRFRTLADDFDEAIGLPSFVRTLIEEETEANSCNVDRASEIWQSMESVTATMGQVMQRVRESSRRQSRNPPPAGTP